MGRPLKYSNDEDRKAALTKSKTNYMLNKHSHMRTKNIYITLLLKLLKTTMILS